MTERISKILPFTVAAFILLMLGSLAWGWLDPFFFGADKADVQGIDFFAVPKSYLNLLEKRSAFDTWGGEPYGPHSTWYLAHPAFSVFVASWFSFFKPWTAYILFTIFSLLLILLSARFVAELSDIQLNKRLAYFFMICSFPLYWMLFVGNMHAPLVLSLTLIFGAFVLFRDGDEKKGSRMLLAGLLISFFSKPIVLLMLPLFLLLRESRKTTIIALLIYSGVSFLFLVVPALNPEGIGLSNTADLLNNPAYVKETMNIFKNNYQLNANMLDNSIHWLNLVAQSDHKLMHIDVFSLPVFVDTLREVASKPFYFKIPVLICLGLSLLVPFIREKKLQLEAALLLCMATSLTFFLSYNTVWEYQYASVLPILALLPILKEKKVFYSPLIKTMVVVVFIVSLPTAYFLVSEADLFSSINLTLIRCSRVLPVLLVFLLMIVQISVVIKRSVSFAPLKEFFRNPGSLFFGDEIG
jgi:hypothetical protein